MEVSQSILSDITVYMKYARFRKDLERRETWKEIVTRNKGMHLKKYPELTEQIEKAYTYVYDKKILPSMRSLQFGGIPIELNNSRIYNCSFLPIDHYKSFAEAMFLLLSGCGVGYSVQRHHVDQLPEIKIPTKTKRYLVNDSIEGWADAVKVLCKAYFTGTPLPKFDFGDIRKKGALLITSGGKAPGPGPLKECLHQIERIFERKQAGEKLTPLESHDIVCYLADAVLSGGIRRAALISLFNLDDEDMLTCKFGNWWETNPQRGRANNSAVILRHKITKTEFDKLWLKIKLSGSGEPGLYFSNDKDWGTNPCCEIALRPYQFCNLCEVNISDVKSQEDLNERVQAATFIGTLQAGYTDFHYLRDVWKKTTEKEALLGIGTTGIGSGAFRNCNLEEAANLALEVNSEVAAQIGINVAARVTTVKPSGTSSLVLGTSSGIHAWHNDYYIRRIRVGKNEAIYTHLVINHPELVEDDFFKPTIQAVIAVPQKAPKNSILRTESALELLERVKKFNVEWVRAGHRKGQNTNNVSATVSIKDNEWEEVGEWMWANKDTFNGLSVLPYDNGTYIQAPFTDCTEEVYTEMVKYLQSVDISKIIEFEDNTELNDQIACAGGVCETAI